MLFTLDMPSGLEEQLAEIVLAATKKAIEDHSKKMSTKEWLNLKEAAAYIGVSNNTLLKFREMGLKICEIEGIKRVSKKEIDLFLDKNSY